MRSKRMIAKRLLQIGTVRASDGSWQPREPWVISSHALRRELGIADSAPFKRTHESLVSPGKLLVKVCFLSKRSVVQSV